MSVVPVAQVSVFLDNRPGSLSEVMAHLDRLGVGIFALSIADAGEFGLVRMIVGDPVRASGVLEDAGFNLAKSRKNTEVTAVLITEGDGISRVTRILGDVGLNIEYAYSSAVHVDGKFALVLRASDVVRAEGALRGGGVGILSLEDMREHFG